VLRQLQAGDPRSVGPYLLLGLLGAGGMGQVFLGRSAGGRLVAVKVIRPELAGEPGFRARFTREVDAARNVSGLFTALVVDADARGPVPWLATAYIAGPSLAEAVDDQGPLPVASVLTLAAGLAEGIQAIHAAGVVHRDLKPSNVLLADDGPRVIDFGISRAVEASMLTQSGTVIGSPGFMSPEQAEGAEVGPPSDIFSLGAVLAFAATGECPFGTGSTPALIYRVVHRDPDIAQLPEQIRHLVERCLAKDPSERPTTGDLLAEVGTGELAADWLPTPLTAMLGRYSPARPPAEAAVAPGVAVTADPAVGEHPRTDAVAGPPTVTAARSRRTPAQAAAPAKPGDAAARQKRRSLRRLAWVAVAAAVIAASVSVAVALGSAGDSRPHIAAPSSHPVISVPASPHPSRLASPRASNSASVQTSAPIQTPNSPRSSSSAASYARAVIADHPVAYWQFNDAAGAPAYTDSSGHGKTLPAGQTTLVSPGVRNHSGAISTADGGAYTTSPLRPLAGDAPRTVEAWFKTNATGCILTAGSATHTQAFSLCLRDGPPNAPTPGAPGFYLATWDADIFLPIANLTDGNWHYLAVTLTGNTVNIIIDGVQPRAYIWNGDAYSGLIAQPFTLPYTPNTAPSPLGIGTSGLGDLPGGLIGTIAEVAVYPRALPVPELVKHYELLAGGNSTSHG